MHENFKPLLRKESINVVNRPNDIREIATVSSLPILRIARVSTFNYLKSEFIQYLTNSN